MTRAYHPHEAPALLHQLSEDCADNRRQRRDRDEDVRLALEAADALERAAAKYGSHCGPGVYPAPQPDCRCRACTLQNALAAYRAARRHSADAAASRSGDQRREAQEEGPQC